MATNNEDDYFRYGETEIAWLKKADHKLAEVIDKVGFIKRRVIPDLFTALVHSIVGQQISAKAHSTVWHKILTRLGVITPERINVISTQELQSLGISFRKTAYIKSLAKKVLNGKFNINALYDMSDSDVCLALTKLDGIGLWSAEMLMLFSMQRSDILSFGDLAIQRGLKILYGHKNIDNSLFEKYRERFSPYGSVASFYLWAVASGAVSNLTFSPQARARPNQTINVQYYHSPCGDLLLGSFSSQLCLCNWINSKLRDKIDKRLKKYLRSEYDETTSDTIREAINQLDEYFSGKRKVFDIPLLLIGTEFQKRVWEKLNDIPYGQTISYSEQAQRLEKPQAVRSVANAIGSNAISIFVPCHRVIGRNNKLIGYAGGLTAKKYLIDLESKIA